MNSNENEVPTISWKLYMNILQPKLQVIICCNVRLIYYPGTPILTPPLKYRALKEELQFRKDLGEKNLVIKNGTITVKKSPHKNFLWRTPVMMTGK